MQPYETKLYETKHLMLHMCTSTQKFKTNNMLIHAASMNESTDMYLRCWLYFKVRSLCQMTLVLSPNENDGY